MLYAKRTRDTYENFEAECPHCCHWNIFNRVSDLNGESCIAFRRVTCLGTKCGGEFAINGDSADAPYAKVFLDAYGMMIAKQYGDAVLNIARAYEMFFAHFLYETLAWKPFVASQRRLDLHNCYGPEDVNPVLQRLTATIEKWPCWQMRNAFVNVAVLGPVATLAEGDAIIAQLPTRSKKVDTDAVNALADQDLRGTLQKLQRSHTPAMRNDVVHKFGRRPSAKEADEIFQEARDLIWNLAEKLDVRFQSL